MEKSFHTATAGQPLDSAAQPLLDEAWTCTRGFAAGVVREGKDFVKFLAEPDAVNRSWLQIGPQLDTAFNYYSDKILHGRPADIGRDAGIALGAIGNFLHDCGSKPPAQKAELAGRAAFQLALSEISAPYRLGVNLNLPRVSGFASTEPLSLARDLDTALAAKSGYIGGAERSLYIGIRNLGSSREFASDMEKILSALPAPLKQILRDRDIEFKTVNAINDIVVEPIDNGRGLYKPDNNSIYLAETFLRRQDWISDVTTEPRILRHEIGHALDHMKELDQWLSDSPAYTRAFARDTEKMSDGRKQFFEHFTAPGTGRREAFAEAYAILHTPVVDADRGWREQFCKSFPNVIRQVSNANLP